MGKNKKNNKKAILKHNTRIDINDLVSAVNKSDKKYGIKLKHPDIWSDPRTYREILEAKAELNLSAIICSINGVSINNYFQKDDSYESGFNYRPIGVKQPLFTSESILEWDDHKTKYKTNSLIFRCRYSTLVLSKLIGKISRVTSLECEKKYKYKHSKDERRILLTKNVASDALLFTKLLMNTESSYQNIILKIHEHISYTKKGVDHVKLRKMLNKHVLEIRSCMQKNIVTGRFFTDDLAISHILNISYMLATNKTNIEELPKFKYIENATVEHDLIKLIEELGCVILDNGSGGKFSPMFRAFIESRPSISTEYHKESNENFMLRIGLLAIGYAGFVINDKVVDKFILKMMRKGK